MNILKYQSDLRSIIFVCLTIFLILIPYRYEISFSYLILWIPFLTLFSFSCCIINHNHIHNSIFFNKKLNLIFNVLLTLAKGHSATTIVVPHLKNHHRHHGDTKDWISPSFVRESKGMKKLLRYLFIGARNIKINRSLKNAPKLSKSQRAHIVIERVALFTWILLGLFINYKIFIFFILIPWLLSMLMLLGVNLLQHEGCEPASKFNHSRNFTGRIGNWFMFNNGFHTIHHLRPSLHWSLLAKEHREKIVGNIDPKLDCESVLMFFYRNYVSRLNS